VDAGAGKADEGAELGGGPLRRRGAAVHTGGVSGEFLKGEELLYTFRKLIEADEECLLGQT